MKVKDIMQTQVDSVFTHTTVRDVSRLIFGRNINGLPVCKEKKVVGFITERDILSKFYPTIQEYMEDPVHMGNFEMMEQNIDQILSLTAEDIMNREPTTVSPDTPLLQAHSLMLEKKVGRLPVVEKKGNLIGIVSKGDIFRTIVGKQIPFEEEEEFYDWIALHYNILIDWNRRLPQEIKDLTFYFRKQKVKKILDVAYGTGEHALTLAKKGFEVVGFETSSVMHKLTTKKRAKLPQYVQNRLTFLKGGYEHIEQDVHGAFNAAMFMGNALPYVLHTDKHILPKIAKLLTPKKSVIILQLVNLQKIFQVQSGFEDFVVRKSQDDKKQEYVFVGFYTKINSKETIYTQVVFISEGKKWSFKGINSTQIVAIGQKEITRRLKKLGFSRVSFYGGNMYEPLFKKSFDAFSSDWMNVIAER